MADSLGGALDPSREWVISAIEKLTRDVNRSADTHLIPFPLPGFPGVDLYFKDESVHPSGSLKHRLARSLFLYALVNGWIREGTTVIEASSGSTAVSEAYFSQLLGLRFIAVMPATTSPEKVTQIARYGGEAHFVETASECPSECRRLAAAAPDGHFIDQFTYAERATDYRGNNNIAASIFSQMAQEPHPEPAFIVCGAGTGGTSATLGRYARYRGARTEVVVADPERSVFADYYVSGDASLTCAAGGPGRIEGIGRSRVEPSFIRSAVDGMVRVPDAFAVGALLYLERAFGRRVGGSTGSIFCAMLTLAAGMRASGRRGSVVGILCDGGERYASTLYSRKWREAHGLSEADVRNAEGLVSEVAGPRGAPASGAGRAAAGESAAGSEGGAAALPESWTMRVLTRGGGAAAAASPPAAR